jgi:hypothetical protein
MIKTDIYFAGRRCEIDLIADLSQSGQILIKASLCVLCVLEGSRDTRETGREIGVLGVEMTGYPT